MRNTRLAIAVALMLLLASCGDSDDAPAGESADNTSVVSTTVAAGGSAATTTPSTTAGPTTVAPSTTTPSNTTAPDTPLVEGQPATWFGVRDANDEGFSYVEERSTTNGSVQREVARFEIGGCIEEGEDDCAVFDLSWAPVAIDLTDDHLGLGMCCEPAVGTSQILRRSDGEVTLEPFGSEPVFSPVGPQLVTVGYADGGAYLMVDRETGDSTQLPIVADWGDRAAWSLDGTMIAVEIGDAVAVVFYDVGLGEVVDVSPTLTPPSGFSWGKPAFQASGNLVVVQDPLGNGPSLGVVLDQAAFGGLAAEPVLAEFGYSGGRVQHQVYDDTGTFLIYVSDDGAVRWLGKGQSGELAPPGSGHVAAAW